MLKSLIEKALEECAPRTIESTLAVNSPAQLPTIPLLDKHIVWQAHDDYFMHHIQCPICQSAGKSKQVRCVRGSYLWNIYEAVQNPNFE